MKREIWFEKFLWSYMPCHWKGIAVMFGIIMPTAAAIICGQVALDAFGYREADWLAFPIFFFPALFLLSAITRRHS